MNLTGVEREYLLLHYSGTDKLYIPTDQLDRVTRFIGMEEAVPALSKLRHNRMGTSKIESQGERSGSCSRPFAPLQPARGHTRTRIST